MLFLNYRNAPKLLFSNDARRQGWLMTLNLEVYKSLDYLIPDYLKIWYGDDWIFSQIMCNNLNYAIYTNRYALHVKGSTTSKLSHIIQQDTQNIEEHGEWFSNITERMHSKRYVNYTLFIKTPSFIRLMPV
jgi:hypothetical protein